MTDQAPNQLSHKVGKLGLAIAAALAVVAGLASPAYANFPHFRDVSVSLDSGSLATADVGTPSVSDATELPDLLFSWTEVGVGNANVVYTLDTFVTATFGCVNGGANRPKATNKTTVTKPVEASAELAADENGRITGNIVLDTGTVSPPADFSCPSGQTQALLSVTFSNNTITDTTNGVIATDDDITVTFEL